MVRRMNMKSMTNEKTKIRITARHRDTGICVRSETDLRGIRLFKENGYEIIWYQVIWVY